MHKNTKRNPPKKGENYREKYTKKTKAEESKAPGSYSNHFRAFLLCIQYIVSIFNSNQKKNDWLSRSKCGVEWKSNIDGIEMHYLVWTQGLTFSTISVKICTYYISNFAFIQFFYPAHVRFVQRIHICVRMHSVNLCCLSEKRMKFKRKNQSINKWAYEVGIIRKILFNLDLIINYYSLNIDVFSS